MSYRKNEREVPPPPRHESRLRAHALLDCTKQPGRCALGERRICLGCRWRTAIPRSFRPESPLHPGPVPGAPTLAPIWLPHWPAWMCTISRMVLAGFSWPGSASSQSVRPPLHTHYLVTGKARRNRRAKNVSPPSPAFYVRRVGRPAQAAPPARAPPVPFTLALSRPG